jgi:hypothetical protein
MKEIQLSQQGKNKGKYFALVDDDEFERLSKHRWNVLKCDKTNYAIGKVKNSSGTIKHMLMHRFLLNVSDDLYIDHINHNGLDNRKENVRVCTSSENNMNKIKSTNKSSIFKGVSFIKRDNLWEAYINDKKRKKKHLGHFISEVEAAKVYDKEALELFGEFANLNFIKQ